MYEISRGRGVLPDLGFTISPWFVLAFSFSFMHAFYLFIFMHALSRGAQKDTMFLRGLLGLWWQGFGAID